MNDTIKIGFIDYYLDEWHANNYPEMFRKNSNGRYKVCCAYGKIDHPGGGITNCEWAEKYGIKLAGSIEQVIEESDRLIVLSPDNPEMHEELCDLPLKSGKLVYVDKTFATDKKTAEKIFANADAHGTKCYSSSALRFASEYSSVDTSEIDRIYSEGPGTFEIYRIHQIEPIVMLMNSRAKRVMYIGDERHPSMIIEFADGRCAQMYHRTDKTGSFRITTVNKENVAKYHLVQSDYFSLFIDGVIKFFDTGVIPVPHECTIDVVGIIEASIKAEKKPFTWVAV